MHDMNQCSIPVIYLSCVTSFDNESPSKGDSCVAQLPGEVGEPRDTLPLLDTDSPTGEYQILG